MTLSPGASRFLILLRAWAGRDLRVRYNQTVLGWVWALAQPAGMSVGLVYLLNTAGARKVPGVPLASFVFTGLLCWNLFSSGLNQAVGGVGQSMSIASKVRFPRVVAPLSGALLPLVDLAIGMLALPVLLLYEHSAGDFRPAHLLLALGGTLLLSVGAGCFLGALSVFVRDLRNALTFILQFGLLATPVATPHVLKTLKFLELNPMFTFVREFRCAFVRSEVPGWPEIARALAVSLLVLGLGLAYFRSVESRFADVA